jgi:hypothetical protein
MMSVPSIDLSRSGLTKFLEYTAEKGLMGKGTVKNRKKACNTILSILDETEVKDLSKLDVEDVIKRHSILTAGQYNPATLTGYHGHLRGAIQDFIEYAPNPPAWRPKKQERKKSEQSIKTTIKTKPDSKKQKSDHANDQNGVPNPPSIHIDFNIHISPEMKPEQIDKIFESMREHLYPKKD